MKELIKFWKYFLVNSLLIILISCDKSPEVVNEDRNVEFSSGILTKEDSIIQLARDLNIDFDENKENVNSILDKILLTKLSLISKLDSLDERADKMESLAYEYKKKENDKLKKKLLSEIDRIKKELDRIRKLSGESDEIVKKDKTSVPEVKVPIEASTFENLPAGNYITRLDKYNLISIYVRENGEVIIGQPRLDSITVIKGGKNLNPRLKKELEQIKKKIKKEFN